MRILSPSVVLLAGLLMASVSEAAELLYFFSPDCGYCRAFDEEVAKVYPKTDVADIAPLIRVEVDPDSFRPIDPGVPFDPGTVPTFILVQEGQEVARLSGYSGDELFWMSLQRMLNLLTQSAPATATLP